MRRKKKEEHKKKKINWKKCWNTIIHSRFWGISWRKIVAPLGLSALCAGILIWLVACIPYLNTWFGMIVSTTPEWYMEAYYNTVNNVRTSPEECSDIVILDVNEAITRQDIADLIGIAAESNPKVIGVDCAFSTSESYSQEQTEYLIHTIAQLPDSCPIAFAYIMDEQSAIPDTLMRHNGFVNFLGFYDYKPFYDNIPHLAVEMAHLAGNDINQIDPSSFLVNYRTKNFFSLPIYSDFRDSDYMDYICSCITGKIVIIGGVTNRLDMHRTPFKISSEGDYIAGSEIVAYALSSILSATTPNKDAFYTQSPYYHHYTRCPKWLDALWTILFTILYLLIYWAIDSQQQKYKFIAMLKPLWLFTIIILTLFIAILITATCYYVPMVLFFGLMTVFGGFWYDVFNNNPIQS